MKIVSDWRDLRQFGFEMITGESCALVYHILFDLDECGANVVRKCFCFSSNAAIGKPWNKGRPDNLHVASIMLSQEMLVPISVFALRESGCPEVYVMDRIVLGFETDDPASFEETMRQTHRADTVRRFSYGKEPSDRGVQLLGGRDE